MGDGTYRDIVHPIAAGLRRVLETAVLEKYTDEVENAPARSAFEESQLKMDA
jgi:DNA-binding cell septation regulator SpoVG